MSLTRKDDEVLNDEWSKTETVSRTRWRTGKALPTPAEVYDRVSNTLSNVALLQMGDTWVFGRMLPLSEIAEDAQVRRLGGTYGIEVIHQAATWEAMVLIVSTMKF